MSSVAQTKDITSHMVAFIKTHGGLDLDEFYEEHAESEVTDIIVEYTKMLLAAVNDDDNKAKLEGLAKKLTPSKKSSRKKKDPDAPKRGKSAYIFFCADKRAEVKEELGEEAKATEVTARLGELWNELKADEDRADEMKVYVDQAAKDKARYEAEMETYKPPSDDGEEDDAPKKPAPAAKKGNKATKKGNKKSTGKKGSKKKTNGYAYFCREHREDVKKENPDMKATDVTKELARMWKELDAEEQQEWKDAAAALE
jgi:high mobility group protein B3